MCPGSALKKFIISLQRKEVIDPDRFFSAGGIRVAPAIAQQVHFNMRSSCEEIN
jgi:hypothetical protein